VLLGIEIAAKRPARVFDSYVTERLLKASRRALANARTLRDAVATVYTVLGKARTSSRVHAIAELLFAGHPLSIASASKIFRISRLAARKHLIRLGQDGLAELATRRKSGLIYIARDGLMTFNGASLVPPPKGSARLAVVTGKRLSTEERTRLDAITDDVANRMHDLDRMLARLNAKAESKG
jgi:DNA-binding transcriptional ArsR family regulator